MRRRTLGPALLSLALPLAGQDGAPAFAAPVDLGPSVITMPLRIPLQPLFQEAERLAPVIPPGVNTWGPMPDGKPGLRLRYFLTREPLAIRMDGARISVHTTAHYWMEVGVHVAGSYVKSLGSCGQGKEGLRHVVLGAQTQVAFTPDWGLDIQTVVNPAVAVNTCQITFVGYDITPKVLKGMEDEMTKASAQVAQSLKTSALLRQKAEEAWRLLNQPVELAPGIFLSLRPERFRLAPLAADGNVLRVTPEVSARPVVTFGQAPVVAPRPLPPLEPLPPGPPAGFRIRIEGDLTFEQATEQLSRQMLGRAFQTEKGSFEITSAAVRGEDGKMLLDLGLKGRITGKVTLSGRPAVDPDTGTLQLLDLDYTLESRSWITQFGEWLFRSSLRQTVREKAQQFLSEGLTEARTQVQARLNQPLTPGLLLRGELTGLGLEQPKVLADRFRMEATLEGRLEAELTQLPVR